MHDAEFPYDVQWTDIDTMLQYLDFTYDKTSFNGLPELVRALQSDGKHYVNIIDPAISSVQPAGSYSPYDDGVKQGIFMKKFNSTQLIFGKVSQVKVRGRVRIALFRSGQERRHSPISLTPMRSTGGPMPQQRITTSCHSMACGLWVVSLSSGHWTSVSIGHERTVKFCRWFDRWLYDKQSRQSAFCAE